MFSPGADHSQDEYLKVDNNSSDNDGFTLHNTDQDGKRDYLHEQRYGRNPRIQKA